MISLSCLSIAIGSVVDDAIVVLENVTTHIERGSSPENAAIHGTNEVGVSVMASTLTMFAVFFPLTMVTGMAGVLFKQLGWMMCIIMLISLVASLTLTPMMCAKMLKLQKKQSKIFLLIYKPIQKVLDAIDNGYAATINWAVRHRWTVLIGCFSLFAVSLLCAGGIKSEFFPSNDSARASATIQLPVGTRVETAREVALKLTGIWKERYGEDLKACNFTVGQAGENNTFAQLSDNGSHIISFNMSFVPSDKRDLTIDEICDQMRADVKEFPEIAKSNISTGQGGMGGQSMATFEIYGYDFAATDSIAKKLSSELKKSNLITQVNISRSDYLPQYCVEFDRSKLAMHGINLSTAATFIRNRYNGALATYYREDGDEYDVKVRYEPGSRQSIEDIENIKLIGKNGPISLKEVGKVVMKDMPPTIERMDRERIVKVDAVMAAGAALSDGVAYGQEIINGMELPSGIAIQVAGSYEDQMDSNRDLGQLAIIILVLVFIVMASQFESLSYPFILMFSVIFALSGVLLGLFVTGSNLNIMSMLGGIMLIGMVVKNGIVLIDYIMLLRERGFGIIAACVNAAKSRLRPVLMTTCTTILGMVPMATSHGVGAEMWRPLGIAVIGGLTVSTIMTMIYVPAMYSIFAAIGVKRKRRNIRKKRELNEYWKEHKDEEQLKHK
jgi:HAE1 family hydrophobic/amphiphilic exporter-1